MRLRRFCITAAALLTVSAAQAGPLDWPKATADASAT